MQKCEECWINQANVHLTQIVHGQTTVLHLCEECARKKGININVATGDILPENLQPHSVEPPKKEIICDNCRMKFSQFQQKGRLGCPKCYDFFRSEIDNMLKQVHGSCLHKGKRYIHKGRLGKETAGMGQLRIQLDEAVKNEEFELAAAIRDTIKSLEAQTAHTENSVECN